MRITYKGDYALKTILELSLNYKGGLVTIHDLAKRLDIPIKFLEQILLELKRGGFVESRRGKIGGYLLAKPPEKIKLGDVVRYIDGPINPIACLNDKYSGCKDLRKCVLREIWQEVDDLTTQVIDKISFKDLAERYKSRNKQEEKMYYI